MGSLGGGDTGVWNLERAGGAACVCVRARARAGPVGHMKTPSERNVGLLEKDPVEEGLQLGVRGSLQNEGSVRQDA